MENFGYKNIDTWAPTTLWRRRGQGKGNWNFLFIKEIQDMEQNKESLYQMWKMRNRKIREGHGLMRNNDILKGRNTQSFHWSTTHLYPVPNLTGCRCKGETMTKPSASASAWCLHLHLHDACICICICMMPVSASASAWCLHLHLHDACICICICNNIPQLPVLYPRPCITVHSTIWYCQCNIVLSSKSPVNKRPTPRSSPKAA